MKTLLIGIFTLTASAALSNQALAQQKSLEKDVACYSKSLEELTQKICEKSKATNLSELKNNLSELQRLISLEQEHLVNDLLKLSRITSPKDVDNESTPSSLLLKQSQCLLDAKVGLKDIESNRKLTELYTAVADQAQKILKKQGEEHNQDIDAETGN